MASSLRVVLVETIKLTRRQIEMLPDSNDKDALHARALRNLEVVEAWATNPPDKTERHHMTDEVLTTHAAVLALVRAKEPRKP